MKLKVWGGLVMLRDGFDRDGSYRRRQVRVVICASNQTRARALLDLAHGGYTSAGEFRNYWSETGMAAELAVATTEGVWRVKPGVKEYGAKTVDDYMPLVRE